MEFLPPITALIIWGFCHILMFYYLTYIHSVKIIPQKIRAKSNKKLMFLILVLTLILFPIFSSLLYKFIGFIEKENNLPWGARIENFYTGAFSLWSISLLILFFLLLIGMITPKLFGFKKRYKLLLSYFILHFYSLYLIIITNEIIPIIANELSRLNSTSGGFD